MITKNKKYKSFQEIETDLKILKLKKEIDLLYLKSNASDLKDNLSFGNIVSNAFSNVGLSFLRTRKPWWSLILGYVIQYLIRRR